MDRRRRIPRMIGAPWGRDALAHFASCPRCRGRAPCDTSGSVVLLDPGTTLAAGPRDRARPASASLPTDPDRRAARA
jgi:hypothetical protein